MLHIQTLPLGAYQTNCYILFDEAADTCVVIDPGYNPEVILAKAAELGKTVCAVLLTHGHFDHVGAVRRLVADAPCPVYIHEKDLSQPEEMTAGPLYYTNLYGEGDVLTLAGLSIRVLHTPGHTQGAVCLMVEDAIISGDTLFMGSMGRVDFPGGNWNQMMASLERLKNLPGDYRVFPGHGPATTLQAERERNPYMNR